MTATPEGTDSPTAGDVGEQGDEQGEVGECPSCYAEGPVYEECIGTEDEPHEPAEFLP